MDLAKIYEKIKKHGEAQASVYVNYLRKLANQKRQGRDVNPWIKNLSDQDLASIYSKEQSKGLTIDGETTTLSFRGQLMITYDYHAYINRLMQLYPESKIDVGIVYKGDNFKFWKDNGKVFYKHDINDPFAENKDSLMVGAYAIVRNSKGEFLELLNMETIAKMKNSAKTQNIWNTWLDRMVLKSAIKRICSMHFHDKFSDMEKTDNEQIEPSNANVDAKLQEEINSAESIDVLNSIFQNNVDIVEDKKAFIEILSTKKAELSEKEEAKND